ncbi:hypothetical protein [Caballeronia sp. HLA56]
MPEVVNFVAKLREAFEDATIDEAVARGNTSEPTFWLGRMTGRRNGVVDKFHRWQIDARVRDRHYSSGCAGACIGLPALQRAEIILCVESLKSIRNCIKWGYSALVWSGTSVGYTQGAR